jgi:hypothetical protein
LPALHSLAEFGEHGRRIVNLDFIERQIGCRRLSGRIGQRIVAAARDHARQRADIPHMLIVIPFVIRCILAGVRAAGNGEKIFAHDCPFLIQS